MLVSMLVNIIPSGTNWTLSDPVCIIPENYIDSDFIAVNQLIHTYLNPELIKVRT